MHISKKGQVTIPLKIREQYGFLPHSEVEFVESNGQIHLKLVTTEGKKTNHGRNLIEHLRGKATATPVDNPSPGAACDATAALR